MGLGEFFRDGLLSGFYINVLEGVVTVEFMPWHWTRGISMYNHVKSIYERAGSDEEGLPAPKAYWFNSDLLKSWYEDRKNGTRVS